VGNSLHIAAEIAAFALFLQHGRHDLAVGHEVGAGEVLVEQAFVGAQVHVGFNAVIEDEDFAMAIGVEGAGIDVVVAFHFDGGDFEAFVLKELGE
jgi:hypothetical protein